MKVEPLNAVPFSFERELQGVLKCPKVREIGTRVFSKDLGKSHEFTKLKAISRGEFPWKYRDKYDQLYRLFFKTSMDHFEVEFKLLILWLPLQLHAADWNLLTVLFGFVWKCWLSPPNGYREKPWLSMTHQFSDNPFFFGLGFPKPVRRTRFAASAVCLIFWGLGIKPKNMRSPPHVTLPFVEKSPWIRTNSR